MTIHYSSEPLAHTSAMRTYAPLDWNGAEASSIVHSWPVRNEPHSVDINRQRAWMPGYETSSQSYGVNIRCNSFQPFRNNLERREQKPAGTSRRCSSFYLKTGVLAHCTEPSYRETKGQCGITENSERAGRNLAQWRTLTYPLSNSRTPSTARSEESVRLAPIKDSSVDWNYTPLPMYKTTHYSDYVHPRNARRYEEVYKLPAAARFNTDEN